MRQNNETVSGTVEGTMEGAPDSLMGFVKSLFVDLDRFFFGPINPSLLGLLRLLAGLSILYIHLVYSLDLLAHVGKDAWIDHQRVTESRMDSPVYVPSLDWTDYVQDKSLSKVNNFSVFFHVISPTGVWVVHTGFLVVILLFTVGLFTRVTAVLAWIATLSYIQRATTSLFGMDTIATIFCTYMMLAPCDRAFSLDSVISRLRRKKAGDPDWDSPPEATGWATFITRMMQIHFSIIYFAAGASKLLGGSWWNGNALWSVMANYEFNPMGSALYMEILNYLASNRVLWEVVTTGGCVYTLVLELAFPFLVWYPRWKWVMMMGAIGLHTMIGILMGLTFFSILMMLLVSSFLPPGVGEMARKYCANLLGLARPKGVQSTEAAPGLGMKPAVA